MVPFLLEVRAQTPKCLIIEEAANGWKSLTSPDYPKKFSPNTQCIYRLTAPEGERIEIEFVDFLLFNNDAEECAAQGLSIRDPQMETIIGKYCGNTKPPNYTTIGNSLFLYLNSNTDGEYKGFHIKYRQYGSSPKLASEVVAAESKSKAKSPKAKQAPVKAGGMGAKILAAMNQKNKIQLKSSQEKGRGGGSRAPARKPAYDPSQTVNTRQPAAPKCRPGYPCPDPNSSSSVSSYDSSSEKREIACIGNGCKNKGKSSKNYLTMLIWFIVIAVFGGIGWYIYQTYFAEDEEKKKKEEEDEKKKEAEGNIGAATLARGLGGAGKVPGFDAPPRYESWQDHAQPISAAK